MASIMSVVQTLVPKQLPEQDSAPFSTPCRRKKARSVRKSAPNPDRTTAIVTRLNAFQQKATQPDFESTKAPSSSIFDEVKTDLESRFMGKISPGRGSPS